MSRVQLTFSDTEFQSAPLTDVRGDRLFGSPSSSILQVSIRSPH